MEIGMASYNPTGAVNIWVNPAGACNATGGAIQAYRGIQVATTNAIVAEMDIGGAAGPDGDGMLGDANEVIRYTYDTVNQYITREVMCGGNQPFLGDVPANVRAVRVINNTLGIPVFRYFNGAGTEITGGLPAQIPNIRRIDIVLAVETENVDPNTGQPRRMIYSTSVIPRNHAIQ
jgi:hypothetical protein